MIKVYQTIVDKNHGNCMQAAIATLFSRKLEEVPNFIELDSWFSALCKTAIDNGYDYEGMLHNKNYTRLWHPTDECFKKGRWHRPSIMTKKALYKHEGVNGLFYAAVLSPNNFNWGEGIMATHAVIIDRDYNVVFDPNHQYDNILEYPLKSLLGYNGIINVDIINPIK